MLKWLAKLWYLIPVGLVIGGMFFLAPIFTSTPHTDIADDYDSSGSMTALFTPDGKEPQATSGTSMPDPTALTSTTAPSITAPVTPSSVEPTPTFSPAPTVGASTPVDQTPAPTTPVPATAPPAVTTQPPAATNPPAATTPPSATNAPTPTPAVTPPPAENTPPPATATAGNVSEKPSFDKSQLENGMVGITYNSGGDGQKYYVVVQFPNVAQKQHQIKADGSKQSIPLESGPGTYKLIFGRAVGGKLQQMYMEEVKLEQAVKDEYAKYRVSGTYVVYSSDSPYVKKAAELCSGKSTEADKVAAIKDYVVKNFSYNKDLIGKLESGYAPDNNTFWSTGTGICFDFASMFAAMCRSQGIAVGLEMGYAEGINGYHAWNRVYYSDGTKLLVDTSSNSLGGMGKNYKPEKWY